MPTVEAPQSHRNELVTRQPAWVASTQADGSPGCESIILQRSKKVKATMAARTGNAHGARPAAILILMALGLALTACGQTMSVPLPDLATTSPNSKEGRSGMTGAEQKQAIDDLIAKRDRAAKEAAGGQ
ncbi:MAG: hypothetical protein AB7O43_19890 [Hyphomicrobiaceae bacterium]